MVAESLGFVAFLALKAAFALKERVVEIVVLVFVAFACSLDSFLEFVALFPLLFAPLM